MNFFLIILMTLIFNACSFNEPDNLNQFSSFKRMCEKEIFNELSAKSLCDLDPCDDICFDSRINYRAKENHTELMSKIEKNFKGIL